MPQLHWSRGKEKIEQPPCEQNLQGFEISSLFFRVRQVEEKRGKIQKPVKINRKADRISSIEIYFERL